MKEHYKPGDVLPDGVVVDAVPEKRRGVASLLRTSGQDKYHRWSAGQKSHAKQHAGRGSPRSIIEFDRAIREEIRKCWSSIDEQERRSAARRAREEK